MDFQTDAEYAKKLDQQDELAYFRDRFVITDPDLIYMDGNSLGRLPKDTITLIQKVVAEEWGKRLIRSWNEGWWLALQERIGGKIAQLVGAQPAEVLIADSTSINLFKLTMAAMRKQSHRKKIITDDMNFPSDVYILQGVCQVLGGDCHIEVVQSPDGIHGPVEALDEAIDDDTALVTLSHTVFKSAFTYDMKEITAKAHRAGAMVLWDLSHSAGSVPVELNAANADLAVGCTYKYLNGGPGSPAFLYIRRDLQEKMKNPITGWVGQKAPFDFGLQYEPARGLSRFLTGTPPILSIKAIEPGVDLLLEAGMDRLRAKSVHQTEYLIALWEATLAPLRFTMNTPPDPARRGSHVSLGHPEGWRIDQVLIKEMNVLPDFRKPDNIRLGIAPLYTSFMDIHNAVMRIREVVTERLYEKYSIDSLTVT